MRSSFFAISKSEFILYLREPSAFFFTLIFPLLMLLLFASMWGNDPFPEQIFGYVDFSVPAFMGLVMVTSFIMSFTTSMAAYREKGILKRFRAAPVAPVSILAGHLSAIFAVTVAGVILLLLAGILFYDLKFWGNLFEFIFVFLLSSAGVAAMGFIPASLAPTARSGAVIANILYFPMIFLSGAALPWFMLPDFLKNFSLIFPLTHAIKLMQEVWLGGHFWEFPLHIAVLAVYIFAGLFISVKFFRWE